MLYCSWRKTPKLSNTIFVGDFNINTQDIFNVDTVMFGDTMQALGLNQHVTEPMHQMGNINTDTLAEEKSNIQVAN